jgi:hypothetical protein
VCIAHAARGWRQRWILRPCFAACALFDKWIPKTIFAAPRIKVAFGLFLCALVGILVLLYAAPYFIVAK